MATVQKTSTVLSISIICRDMSETILKIDNPKDNLTLNNIKNAFLTVIPGTATGYTPQLLFNKAGEPYRYVNKAAKVTTVVTSEDLT